MVNHLKTSGSHQYNHLLPVHFSPTFPHSTPFFYPQKINAIYPGKRRTPSLQVALGNNKVPLYGVIVWRNCAVNFGHQTRSLCDTHVKPTLPTSLKSHVWFFAARRELLHQTEATFGFSHHKQDQYWTSGKTHFVSPISSTISAENLKSKIPTHVCVKTIWGDRVTR